MSRAAARRIVLALVAGWLALSAGPLAAAAEELGVIPTRIIYPNETISGDALKMARVRKGKPSTVAFAHDPAELIGKVAKRTLLPGRFVPLGAVREVFLVQQGAPVQVVLSQGGLTITMTAITLEPGSAGDVVKVRNTDSGAVFTAIVMADGTVRVGAT
jgi:flagella basal body P-ring formation protein FlgA